MNEPHATTPGLDLDAIRARLAGTNGRDFWRGLEELAETPEFTEFLHREFPRQASEWVEGSSRRGFLRLMGASLALAGASGCGLNKPEKIVPYVRAPETIVPGRPLFFATSLSLGGYATGVLVESHMGRPIKVEGNEKHPASLGATDAFAQASVLSLYDPDRSQVVLREGQISTFNNFLADLTIALEEQRARKGAGLRILTETVGSPTLASQIRTLLDKFPEARWYQYEPANRDQARAGALAAFGEDVQVQYNFEKADVILALDADFLSCGPASLRYARQFADRRRLPSGSMNRLYVVESMLTTAGATADHRLPLRPGAIGAFARSLARELGIPGAGGGTPEPVAGHSRWIGALARDLKAHRGTSLVVVGDEQPSAVHALVHAINDALGNVGQTVVYTEPVLARSTDQMASLRGLVGEMESGSAELLVILGGNPAYSAPADLDFARAVRKVPRAIHLGQYVDETSALCRWHLPEAHEFESWGDARAFDGTASLLQPLIAPLYGGMSSYEVLSSLLDGAGRPGYDIVRDYWRGQKLGGDDFETAWETALHDGLIAGTALAPKQVTLKPGAFAAGVAAPAASNPALEISFRPDPTIWDGRFANNGWLQELPKPMTKLTWDNAALVSPKTAQALGLDNEDLVELRYRGRSVHAPVWVTPGHAEGCVTVSLGYGRTRAGQIGNGAGFDANALRTSEAPDFDAGLEIRKTGRKYPLACTQVHRSLEGRNLYRVGTLEQYQEDHHFAHEGHEEPKPDMSLYPQWSYEGNAWGMVVNLNACIGCNACVVACQAENNIPIVGKEEVLRGREMHWLEIDRYFSGDDLDDPETYLQPRLCMHCENAPCEVVCPVAATTHSPEGLNEMTYNRCVGTRYCQNNCPYKVRHFNFFEYSAPRAPVLTVLNNPDVTVRSRGVMEKCTYCVQRINAGRIQAKQEGGREIRDGEVVTACQAACPTRALVFGNINDPSSEVAKLRQEPLNYAMLAELNTRPRTTYLARVRNPNPELEPESRHVVGKA